VPTDARPGGYPARHAVDLLRFRRVSSW
jgi:hypothetical protein